MSQDMLAETSLAGQDAVISFLASSASLQQFAQTAVAFLLMQTLQPPRTADSLSSRAEELLEKEFQVGYGRRHCTSVLPCIERILLAFQGDRSHQVPFCEGSCGERGGWGGLLVR